MTPQYKAQPSTDAHALALFVSVFPITAPDTSMAAMKREAEHAGWGEAVARGCIPNYGAKSTIEVDHEHRRVIFTATVTAPDTEIRGEWTPNSFTTRARTQA